VLNLRCFAASGEEVKMGSVLPVVKCPFA
jgi:hypothetical protein